MRIVHSMQQMTKYEHVLNILEKSPAVGLYLNQSPADWDYFFKFFCKFLLTEEGPRGVAIRFSREYLTKDQHTTKEMIQPLGLKSDCLIRDVYVKFKQYIPTPLYVRFQIDGDKLREVEKNTKLIVDSNSMMYKSIQKGLLDKHGPEYDIEGKMKEITDLYLGKFEGRQEHFKQLVQELNKCEEYIKYEQMREYLKPVIEQFDKVEKQIGVANVERGKMFEEKCRNEGLTEVYQRMGKDHYQVVTNCRWEPRELGEVDIALIEKVGEERIVTVLIECKARLFDIVAAEKQIGPQRIHKNKRLLRVGNKVLPVSEQAEYFIITGLPTNEYHLPFESRLKVELERATKTLSYAEMDSKLIYDILFPKFENELSPLDWFKQEASQHLIII